MATSRKLLGTTTSSSSVLQPAIKQGLGWLTASADAFDKPTRLTQIAHKAPLRLLPVGTSPVRNAGAAICALSNYGAGMLQGDSSLLSITVKAGAKLGITSQGANRIYKRRNQNDDDICKTDIQATVQEDGFLVVAPDFCSMFASSSLEQKQVFEIHPSSSVVLIDWFSSGRYQNGERWQFSSLKATTKLQWIQEDNSNDKDNRRIPFLQDSIWLQNDDINSTRNEDPFGVDKVNTFASLILYGDQADSVVQNCKKIQNSLVARHTRIRVPQDINQDDNMEDYENDTLVFQEGNNGIFMDLNSLQLSGRVSCGVSDIPVTGSTNSAKVVRFAATNSEDLYRVFHYLLSPLEKRFGYSFYKDRISARASFIPPMNSIPRKPLKKRKDKGLISQVAPNNANNSIHPSLDGGGDSSAMWAAYMLADSAMPTGSFAHSAGLEAAAQLGLIADRNDDEIAGFIQAATRSNVQVTTPFLIAGHALYKEHKNDPTPVDEWKYLNAQAQAILCTNTLACAASLDQGKSLARVAKQWLYNGPSSSQKGEDTAMNDLAILNEMTSDSHHIGPVLGVVGSKLGLSEQQVCDLFAYCVARDMVSAAVRLSLVGPLASVRLLHGIQKAAEAGMEAVRRAMAKELAKGNTVDILDVAATCSPVIEAVHPCHELLQVRLFRS
jgi:urease accessory protein UreH/urease accessory protein UreF